MGLKRRLKRAERNANHICQSVPKGLKAPLSEMVARNCTLSAFNECHPPLPIGNDDLPKPFIPSTKYELKAWELVDSQSIYISGTTIPIYDIGGETKKELQYAIKKAMEVINMEENADLKFETVESGYLRYDGTWGREYILDLILSGKKGSVHRRVNLLRVHQPELVVLPETGEKNRDTRINFIVPISKVSQRFTEFLHMYEDICLKTQENVRLILVVYGQEDLVFVKDSVEKYAKRHPSFQFKIIFGTEEFSRARAMDLGLSVLTESELAFLCDVDMTIELSFLSRCRMNPIRGKRVYFPAFFKYYNMDYVYRFKRKPFSYKIKREHGHWAVYSYGMVCIYKSDYTAAGGFDKSIVGWGGEDVSFLSRIIEHKLEVLRAPDPSLSHRYHDKTCSSSLQPTQFAMCISSRNENLADRGQLAEYVFYLEGKYGITHRTLWDK